MSNQLDRLQVELAALALAAQLDGEILRDVFVERVRQDAKHGGTVHDDTHTMADWLNIVNRQASRVHNGVMGDEAEMRERLVKVAAVALAGLASYARKETKVPDFHAMLRRLKEAEALSPSARRLNEADFALGVLEELLSNRRRRRGHVN